MIGYLVRRLIGAGVVMLGAALATFTLLWLAPGDPAEAVALARFGGEGTADAATIARIRAEQGLDAGFGTAFLNWLGPLLRLDLGRSAVSGGRVAGDLIGALGHTLPLALAAIAVALAVALPLAVVASRRPGGWVDMLAVALASLGAAVPAFWLGLMLIVVFAVELGWLPAFGAGSPRHLVLPALTLALGTTASLTRILRSGLIEARAAAFIPALRGRGVGQGEVMALHVAPHAAIPFLSVLGLELAFLIEGAVVVEVIFARPGLGSFLVEAIRARDFPKVQAMVLFSAALFVLVNLLVDLAHAWLDPRIRHAR